MRSAWLAAALVLAAGCGPGERERLLGQLEARSANGLVDAALAAQRADAVRGLERLARPDDEEVWAAFVRATRDRSIGVRAEAARALAAAPREAEGQEGPGSRAEEALGTLLAEAGGPADATERVRTAAAEALSRRCGARAVAALRGAFLNGGTLARNGIVQALGRCGERPEAVFLHAEEFRRRKANDWIDGPVSGQRVWGAGELALLGRQQDARRLASLLEHRDGALVAAAARGLGLLQATSSAARLAELAADPAPPIAAAAIAALQQLGPGQLAAASGAMERQARSDGEAAVAAASGLRRLDGSGARRCPLALSATDPKAAALLAAGCPAAPIGSALADAVAASGPVGQPARARVLLAALAGSRPGPLPPAAGKALGRLATASAPEVAASAVEVAGIAGAREAAPAILALLRRERAARMLRRHPAAPSLPGDEDSAATLRRQEARTAAADPDKLARLQKLLARRDGARLARSDAAERLGDLLAGSAGFAGSRLLLLACLRAAALLSLPGAREEAEPLATDPDPEVARAALAASGTGAPGSTPVPEASDRTLALDCLAAAGRAGGPLLAPGCAARLAELAGPGGPAVPPAALPRLRLALLSDEAGERASACALLGRLEDAGSAPLRAGLAEDPERRVRLACGARKETAGEPTR